MIKLINVVLYSCNGLSTLACKRWSLCFSVCKVKKKSIKMFVKYDQSAEQAAILVIFYQFMNIFYHKNNGMRPKRVDL